DAGGENAPIPRLSIQDLQSQVGGGIFETYFAQQHHITAPISGQTPGHSIETFSVCGIRTSRTTPTPS
ncbi:MAG TPA: hypothetical protein VEM33_01930, partial [Burkholderiales bacterium]|nr:hypothetical protein [Burkholderiales bacterium]